MTNFLSLIYIYFSFHSVNSFGIPLLLCRYANDLQPSTSMTKVRLSQDLEDQNDTTCVISAEDTKTTPPSRTTAATTTTTMSATIPICEYSTVQIQTSYDGPPRQTVSTEDLTPIINRMIQDSGIVNGFVTIISRHTTTAITINERESRLANDMEEYFLTKLAPPDERSCSPYSKSGLRYYHNDIDERPDSAEECQRCMENGWDISNSTQLTKWRQQEPINAHSHLLSMLVGSSECIPIQNKVMVLGQWQSVLLVDLDGPRDRTVGIQLMGFK
jgi:thiamine phosphate synthase YjbQ (UPF0047 family)